MRRVRRCLVDQKPRKLTVEDYRVLNSCAEMVVRTPHTPLPSSAECLQAASLFSLTTLAGYEPGKPNMYLKIY